MPPSIGHMPISEQGSVKRRCLRKPSQNLRKQNLFQEAAQRIMLGFRSPMQWKVIEKKLLRYSKN